MSHCAASPPREYSYHPWDFRSPIGSRGGFALAPGSPHFRGLGRLRCPRSQGERAFATDTKLVSTYFLEQDKKDFTAQKAPSYYVSIGARVGEQKGGPFSEGYPSNGRPLEKGLHIQFRVESCNVPKSYEVRWEVTNIGREAELNNVEYHDSGFQQRGDKDFETRDESTKYKGSHYMDCVIHQNGKRICKARHVVNIQ
jgi:Adenylyl/Guanylyl and SMODS C-terminal sensor domain